MCISVYVWTLQLALNRLNDWAEKWELRFNPGKCEAMRVTP